MSNKLSVIVAIAMLSAVVATSYPAHALQVFGSQTSNQIGTQNEFAQVGLDFGAIVLKYDEMTGAVLFNPDGSYTAGNIAWPISPNWALRANHVSGGQTGYDISFGGELHRVMQAVTIPGSDLNLVRVDNPFNRYATMYDPTLTGEIGKQVVMVGTSGLMKDPNNLLTSVNDTFVNGWEATVLPANESGKPNWGLNCVEEIYLDRNGGEVLHTTFDYPTLLNGEANPRSFGDNEATGNSGDSGGGVFIKQGNEWRIAGVIYAVDSAFASMTSREELYGAIYDGRNLYGEYLVDENNPNGPRYRELITGADRVPFGTYSTRVGAYRSQIDNITGQTRGLGVVVPEAGTAPLALLGVGGFVFAAIVRRRVAFVSVSAADTGR